MLWQDKLTKFFYDESGLLRRHRTILTGGIGVEVIVIVVGILTGNRILEFCCILIPAAYGGIRRQYQTVVVRRLRIKEAEGHTIKPNWVGPYLLPGEHAEYEGREHFIALLFNNWLWVLVIPITLIAAGVLVALVSHLGYAIPIALLLAAGTMSGPIIQWWRRWRVLTRGRVMVISGLLKRKAPSIPLSKLDYVTPIDPVVLNGVLEFFGQRPVRHYKFDTPSQSDPFNELDFVPQPESCNPRKSVQALLQRNLAADDSGELPGEKED